MNLCTYVCVMILSLSYRLLNPYYNCDPCDYPGMLILICLIYIGIHPFNLIFVSCEYQYKNKGYSLMY